MNRLRKYWLFLAAGIFSAVCLITPIVAITLMDRESNKKIDLTKVEAMNKDKKFWKITNSYLSVPVANGQSISNSIRDYLKLNDKYIVSIYRYKSDITKTNWKKIDQLPVNIYSPTVAYSFDYCISEGEEYVASGSIDNSWILDKAIGGIKADYLSLLNFNQNISSEEATIQFKNNLSVFSSDNADEFENNIKKNNIGSSSDIPYIFSGLKYESIIFDEDHRDISINSEETANMLNKIVKVPDFFNFDHFEVNSLYPFFENIKFQKNYVHQLLGLPITGAPRFSFDASALGLSESSTVKEVKTAVGSFVSDQMFELSGVNRALEKPMSINMFNDIRFYKSGGADSEWTDNQSLKDIWKLKDGDPDAGVHYAWVDLKGTSDSYSPFGKIMNYPSNNSERVWFNFVLNKDGER